MKMFQGRGGGETGDGLPHREGARGAAQAQGDSL